MARVGEEQQRRWGHRADAPVPISTYRLQLGAHLTFTDVASHLDYFSRLGITHLYLSPILTAAPESTHFYDVVDHSHVSEVLGGETGLRELAAQARERGIGLIADVVPNHMAVPTPAYHNAALWSVLSLGDESPYAHWFDVDWASGDPVLMPVLGERLGTVIAQSELSIDSMVIPGSAEPQPVLRYYDHVFPIKQGTENLPLETLVDQQHYRLAYWRVANEELNYRRFFDVGSLVALRIEDPDVFHASHDLLISLVNDGTLQGLRIDHPDGLADPAEYLSRLAEATGGAWVVVEKILEDEERMPTSWKAAGTTGYDAAWRIGALLRDPAGSAALAGTMHRVAGDAMGELPGLIATAKREIVKESLSSEMHRLATIAHQICHADVRLRDHTWRALYDCLRTLVVTFDRYRAYVAPGRPTHPPSLEAIDAAAGRARELLDGERHETLDVVVDLLKGREVGSAGRTHDALRAQLVTRFQQACGAVMAKGVEDTAFYRWTHLLALCEVGSPAHRFALPPSAFHAWAQEVQQVYPHAMTCLSTHDTKRSEDVRARLGVLSEAADEWNTTVTRLQSVSQERRPRDLDGRLENLWWQTLVATSDVGTLLEWDRLERYLIKAMREAKTHTTWTAVNNAYEQSVLDFARWCHGSAALLAVLDTWHTQATEGVRAATLSMKLIQLTAPGIPDVYQGNETVSPTLVDPDNRSPVEFSVLSAALQELDEGARAKDLASQKLWVTAQSLRTRRDLPGAFIGARCGYAPLAASTGNAVVFARTEDGDPMTITVATRNAWELARLGGWGDHTLALPTGTWRCVLTGAVFDGGSVPVAEVLSSLPVALLVRA